MSAGTGNGHDDTQDPSSDRRELEHQIEETRAELAGAVDALAYKADVKARAKDKAQLAGQRAQEVGRSPQGRKAGVIGLGVVVLAVIAWLVVRRRS